MNAGTEMAARSFDEIFNFLNSNAELSNATFILGISPKVILVSAASSFEKRILTLLENCAINIDDRGGLIVGLVKIKAIKRQYHTYFDWEGLKLGPFYNIIGTKISEKIKVKTKKELKFKQAIDSFLEIGSHRNHLVHDDFLAYPLGLTLDIVNEKVTEAVFFISWLEDEAANDYRKINYLDASSMSNKSAKE